MKPIQFTILCACVLAAPMFPVVWEESKIAKVKAAQRAESEWQDFKRALGYLKEAGQRFEKDGDVEKFKRSTGLWKFSIREYLDGNAKSNLTRIDGPTLVPAIEGAHLAPSVDSVKAMLAEIARVSSKHGFSYELK